MIQKLIKEEKELTRKLNCVKELLKLYECDLYDKSIENTIHLSMNNKIILAMKGKGDTSLKEIVDLVSAMPSKYNPKNIKNSIITCISIIASKDKRLKFISRGIYRYD